MGMAFSQQLTVLFATVLSYGKPLKRFAMISGDNICLLYTNSQTKG